MFVTQNPYVNRIPLQRVEIPRRDVSMYVYRQESPLPQPTAAIGRPRTRVAVILIALLFLGLLGTKIGSTSINAKNGGVRRNSQRHINEKALAIIITRQTEPPQPQPQAELKPGGCWGSRCRTLSIVTNVQKHRGKKTIR